MQKINDLYGVGGDLFGSAVSISGDYAIVGTLFTYLPNKINDGSATIYQRIGIGWQRLQFITDPGGVENNFGGNAVCIDGITKRFVIGAYGYVNYFGKGIFGNFLWFQEKLAKHVKKVACTIAKPIRQTLSPCHLGEISTL